MNQRTRLYCGVMLILVLVGGALVAKTLSDTADLIAGLSDQFVIFEQATLYERAAGNLQLGSYLYARNNVAMGRQLVSEAHDGMAGAQQELAQRVTSDHERAALEEIFAVERAATAAANAVVEQAALVRAGDLDAMSKLTLDLHFLEARIDALTLKLEMFVDRARDTASGSLSSGLRSIWTAMMVSAGVFIVVFFVAVFMWVSIGRERP